MLLYIFFLNVNLMRVDGVVDERPADAGRVQREAYGRGKVARSGGVAQQGAPVEGAAQHCLGPVGVPVIYSCIENVYNVSII
jgi:hypothetical protein